MPYEFTSTGFVADAVIAHLQRGNFSRDNTMDLPDELLLIDSLRKRITQDDVPRLLQILDTQEGPAASLACSLLREYITQNEVRDSLKNRWVSASAYLKNRIMWRPSR
jgi:hypothetical protein